MIPITDRLKGLEEAKLDQRVGRMESLLDLSRDDHDDWALGIIDNLAQRVRELEEIVGK